MTINKQTNGYEKYVTEGLTNRLAQFEAAVEKVFGYAVKYIDEFYYGDKLVMVDIRLDNDHYGSFNITENRISFNGHTCTHAEYEAFGCLTLNDECFKGGMIA